MEMLNLVLVKLFRYLYVAQSHISKTICG